MRIVFAGTPEFAARHLSALIDSKLDVVAVYTQPDRPSGRGKKLKASDVKVLAGEHDIPVCQPENFKQTDAIDELEKWQADIMVVVAYGIILPEKVLSLPPLGCINVHGSLLPKWRGAAPIQRAIWAGDKQTGVTIMQMDEGLDTGPMLTKSAIDITPQDTSSSMYEKLAVLGPQALVQALQNYSTLTATPQDNSVVSYAKKLSKEEAKIDWQLTAVQLERNCRAFNPWPVQWFPVNDTPIKVWECCVVENGDVDKNTNEQSAELVSTSAISGSYAPGEVICADKSGIVVATGTGRLRLTKLQLPGKKPLAVSEVLNGRSDWFVVGSTL